MLLKVQRLIAVLFIFGGHAQVMAEAPAKLETQSAETGKKKKKIRASEFFVAPSQLKRDDNSTTMPLPPTPPEAPGGIDASGSAMSCTDSSGRVLRKGDPNFESCLNGNVMLPIPDGRLRR